MSTGPDNCVEVATALLRDIEEGDSARAAGPEADRLVEELGGFLAAHEGRDAPGSDGAEDGRVLTARALLARILWHRSMTAQAVDYFIPLFFRPSHSDAIPAELLQEVADHAEIHAHLALQATQYAVGMRRRGQRLDRADFDELVERWRMIVAAPVGPRTNEASRVSNLGAALSIRFAAFQDIADLDAAIDAGRKGITRTGSGDKALAMRLQSVGGALFTRFRTLREPDDLDAAVSTLRAALDASMYEPEEHSAMAMDLAVMLNGRFQAARSRGDLDESVTLARLAVNGTPEGHPLRVVFLGNFGNLLRLRFDEFGAVEDLDEAIAAGRTAVDETDEDDPVLSMRLLGLSGSLYIRFGRYGAVADLDEAIAAARRGVGASDDDGWGHELLLSHLGLTLHARFTRFGATSDLKEAAVALIRAVLATPEDEHLHLAGNNSNLSIALFALYKNAKALAAVEEMPGDELETQALAHLDRAIEAARAAVAVAGTPDAAYLAGLGVGLQTRYDESGAMADLEEATACLHHAVKITPEGHPDRPGHLSNLAMAVQSRYEGLGEPTDLDEAIELVRAALQCAPRDRPGRISYLTNLADLLRIRYERSGSPADAREAVAHYAKAVGTREAPPSVRVTAGRSAAAHFGTAFPLDVARMLDTAVELLPKLAARHLERSDQQYALGGLAAGLASDAAALTLERTDLSASERAERALRLLEAGRGVLLSQALDTRSDLTDLRRVRPDLAERYVDLREILDSPDSPYRPRAAAEEASARASFDGLEAMTDIERDSVLGAPGPRDPQADRRAAATAFDAVLEEIRGLPGLSGFARLADLRELTAQAAAGPLIAVNVSRYRCDALLLSPEGVRAVPLRRLENAALLDRADAFQRALLAVGQKITDSNQAEKTLGEVLVWLWDSVAEPVLDTLGFTGPPAPGAPEPRVWWMAGGLLSLLPLHAAGHHGKESGGRAVIDRVVSSYTPTVRALQYARERAGLGAESRPSGPVSSLIVSMPTTPGRPGAELRSSRLEAAELEARLPAPQVLMEPDPDDTAPDDARTPTAAAVLDRLDTCTIAHFSCHGKHYPQNPSGSMLFLHDHATEPLTVAALMRVRLDHVQLAYLSACHTANQGRQLLDESVHLASAFQLVGFPQVIATLWKALDRPSQRLAVAFYDLLAEGRADGSPDTDRAAHALHSVVRKLREKRFDMPSHWAAYLHAGA